MQTYVTLSTHMQVFSTIHNCIQKQTTSSIIIYNNIKPYPYLIYYHVTNMQHDAKDQRYKMLPYAVCGKLCNISQPSAIICHHDFI